MAELFGFKIEKSSKDSGGGTTFSTPTPDDGTIDVAGGGFFGQILDTDGRERTDLDLIRRYRDIAQQAECDTAIEDIINESFQNQQLVEKPITTSAKDSLKCYSCTTDDETCCICQIDIKETEDIIELPCGHKFHSDNCDCPGIMPWLEHNNTCPLCKHELPCEDRKSGDERDMNVTDISSVLEEEIDVLAKKTKIELKKLKKLVKILEDQKTKDIPFPGWEALDEELNESKPEVVLVIKNSDGKTVTQLSAPYKKGITRVSWELNTKLTTAVKASAKRDYSSIQKMVSPGIYTVSMFKRVEGVLTDLEQNQQFEVERIRKNTLSNPMASKHEAYYNSIAELTKKVNVYQNKFDKANTKVKAYQKNLNYINNQRASLTKEVYELVATMNSLEREIGGSPSKEEIGEKDNVSLFSNLYSSRGGWYPNSYGPTELHMKSFNVATELFQRLQPKIDTYLEKVNAVGKKMEVAGAPILLD